MMSSIINRLFVVVLFTIGISGVLTGCTTVTDPLSNDTSYKIGKLMLNPEYTGGIQLEGGYPK